jgi:hypothetical protein
LFRPRTVGDHESWSVLFGLLFVEERRENRQQGRNGKKEEMEKETHW